MTDANAQAVVIGRGRDGEIAEVKRTSSGEIKVINASSLARAARSASKVLRGERSEPGTWRK